MDVIAVSRFLIPCVPFLVKKAGEVDVGDVVSKVGKNTWEVSQKIWAVLKPKIDLEAATKVIMEELAKKPDETVWQEAFKQKLTEMLENDAELRAALGKIKEGSEEAHEGGDSVTQTIHTMDGGQAIASMKDSKAANVDSSGSNSTINVTQS
ncbi:hypothetical protein K4A83_08850 [Spirulina subsalsa FACHB-351]|uniref:Uncharacterized protein n=1 Tax=Spirulina subsalsa FACHB-351 TaxID=234711 RepID=A0ABT3L4H3_9CYAN|nr:hypothetical protein [Spirulina subsalsa]MCW6036375.1 hypothetical protein [Spirulina subsalsa FACHB-351]